MTTDELGKNFHMHARFYVKGKGTDVSPGKVAKEMWRITKLDKNSTHIVFHDNIHKLTSYMAGHKKSILTRKSNVEWTLCGGSNTTRSVSTT